MADRHLPDIIIDDGSHIEEHQIFTFGVLFPKLKPGGVYIVEDISSSVKSSAAEFYINLQREVLSRKGMQDISSIECIPGAVIIRKSINDELDYNINAIESIVLDAKSTDSSVYLAVYVMDKDLPFDRKVRVAQSAIRLNENNPWTYFNLGQIFAAYGHYQEAVTAVDQARAVALCVTPTFEEARARWIEALSDRAERASQPEAV